MRFTHVLRSVLPAVVALSLVLVLSVLPGAAQEATPGAASPAAFIQVAPGLTAEVFAAVPSDRAPGQTVYVVRFVFAPGAEIGAHSHPGTTVLAVERGTLGWTLEQGTAHVVRGAAQGASGEETVADPGAEVLLQPGDAIRYEDDVTHTARNAGDGDVVLLASMILESGQPLLKMAGGMNMSATPAA